MAEVIPQITLDGTKIKNTWTEKEYVTDEVYNALNKAVIDLKNNNNLLDTNSMLFREAYNSSSKNLNNAIHQGIYSFTNSAINAPSGVNGGNLLVTNTTKTEQGSSIITQIAFCHNGAVYARTKNASENFTAWNKLAYITDNVASATKAEQDGNGNTISSTYVNKVNGTADGLTCVDDTFGGQLTVKRNSTNSVTIKFTNTSNVNRYVGFTNSDKTMYKWGDSGTDMTAFLDASNYNNYAPTKTGSGASGTWGININGNASTSTKATQDSQGQQINTTYVKGVTASNDTLTITKGNGTTSTVTINNVSRAIADKNGLEIDTGYLKLSGGTVTGILNINSIESIAGNILLYFTDDQKSFGFYDNNTSSNVLWYKNSEKILRSEVPITAPTPSGSDNSNTVATTAFVKSLFTASKTTNGWHKEASTGIIWQWGTWNISSTAGAAETNVTFPIAFPNACLYCIPSVENSATDQIGYKNLTNTGCIIKKGAQDNMTGRNGKYLVIGY